MKKVNKTFLEEQVRQVLSEQEKKKPGLAAQGITGFLTTMLAAAGGGVASSVGAHALKDVTLEDYKNYSIMMASFIRDVAIGSQESYQDVKNQFKALGQFGIGAQSHYLEAMDSVKSLGSPAIVNWANLMIRFYRTMPIEPTKGFNPKTLNLVAREDIANELWKIKSWAYTKLLPVLRVARGKNARAKKAKYINEIKDILTTVSYDNNLSFAVGGGLDESVEDIASEYGFTKSMSYKLWGKTKIKNSFRDSRFYNYLF